MPTNQNQKPTAGMSLSRALDITVTRGEGDNRVQLAFSSETPYRRWYGDEILSHAHGAVELERLRTAGVVLYAHGSDFRAGRMPIAKITDVWLDSDNVARAEVEFDMEDSFAAEVLRKVNGGFIRGVSVGYRVLEWEYLQKAGQTSADGRFTAAADETYIAVRWEPYEISIEPVPADPTVGIGRTIENTNTEGETEMPPIDERTNPVTAEAPQNAPEQNTAGARTGEPKNAPAASGNDPVAAERTRASEITELCRTFHMDPAEHIRTGATIDQVRSAILDQLAQQNPAGAARVTADEGDKFRDAVSDAILMRSGAVLDAQRTSAAKNFRSMRLRSVANECLARAGVQDASYMDDNEAFARALSPDSAFAAILSDAVSKSMAREYAAAPSTFEAFTTVGTLSDFKASTIYRLSEAGDLLPIPQGAEFKFDEMRDEGSTAKLVTYGRSWGFTREAMINDDLSALSRVPAAYVRAYRRLINKLAYKVLVGIDYSEKNGNLAPAGAISVATVGKMRALMRKQKNIRGKETLNIEGKLLLVPAELEVAARELVGSIANPAGGNSGVTNIYRNSLDPVVDAELDEYSEKAWYLAADPADVEGIRVSYLNGKKEPNLESRAAWDRLGMEWRIYGDVGVDLVDKRAFVKNEG